MFTINEIRELIKMIDQSSLQRFEFEHDKTKLILIKNGMSDEQLPSRPILCDKEPMVSNDTENLPPVETKTQTDLKQIVSPVVGTFYAAPEPGAEAFVKVGQTVTADTIVCVVEVMKLFNEVEAKVNGEIVEVLVNDGQFVEYGQPLFLVKSIK